MTSPTEARGRRGQPDTLATYAAALEAAGVTLVSVHRAATALAWCATWERLGGDYGQTKAKHLEELLLQVLADVLETP